MKLVCRKVRRIWEEWDSGKNIFRIYCIKTFKINSDKKKECVSRCVGTPTEVFVGLENCFLIRLWSLTCLELVTVTQQYIL